MTEQQDDRPSDSDGADAANRIATTGVADESAAYVDAIQRDRREADDTETEAHPS